MTPFVLDARTATPHFPGIGRYVANLRRALPACLQADERLVVYERPELGVFGLRQQWGVPRDLRRLGAACYHSPYYLMPYRPGAPTVLTVYDCIPLRFPQHVSARARLLFRQTMRLALRAADQVIAISQATADDVRRLFGPLQQPLTVIPLAADDRFAPQPAAAVAAVRDRLGLPEPYMLYVGSAKPHKNLPRLLAAWERLQPTAAQLVIAGAWDGRADAAPETAAALVARGALRLLGRAADADLPALYSGALGFVFPSLYEGFGLPPLEAMACGAPVIASRTAGLAETVGEAALLIDPADTAALVAALQRLLDDPALRADLAARGRAHAARFTWAQTAVATAAVYRQAVASTSSAAGKAAA